MGPVKRNIIVYIATSADGYIARPDGDVEWLTKRPAPHDFYGWGKFIRSIDTKLFGRKTYELSVQMGAKFDTNTRNYVFSRKAPPDSIPAGVEFVTEAIGSFSKRLREGKGKDIFLMGGGELIASFLDAGEIDEFDIHVIPTFIGDGIRLIAPRHRDIALKLVESKKYPDGVVRLRYSIARKSHPKRR
jgi:dihydrofolate reductase